MTTEIIVYRNPVEAAIWGALSTSDAVVPVFAGIVVFFLALFALHSLVPKAFRKTESTYTLLGVCAVFGIATTYWMM